MGKWEEIFQVLEAEAQQSEIMFSEGIRRLKGAVINMTKHTTTFTKLSPEEMSLSWGEDTIAWLCERDNCDQEEKSLI